MMTMMMMILSLLLIGDCVMPRDVSLSMQAHHASPTLAAVAASLQTSGFQDIHTCFIVCWLAPLLCA